MRIYCYKGKFKNPEIKEPLYGAKYGGLELNASDLAGLAEEISAYARFANIQEGVQLSGRIKSLKIRSIDIIDSRGLCKEVLEELAIMVANKIDHKLTVRAAA